MLGQSFHCTTIFKNILGLLLLLKIPVKVKAFNKVMAEELWLFCRKQLKVHAIGFVFSFSDNHLVLQPGLNPASSDCGAPCVSSGTLKLCQRVILQLLARMTSVWHLSWKLILWFYGKMKPISKPTTSSSNSRQLCSCWRQTRIVIITTFLSKQH